MNTEQMSLRRGHSLATDPRQAVQELRQAIAQPAISLVIFFCSSDYDLDALASEINAQFAGVPVLGCTTAGEIGPAGYRAGSLVGISFSSVNCSAVVGRIDGVTSVDESAVRADVWALRRQVADVAGSSSFALLLIDGLSCREELIAHGCQSALGNIPLVGGSAGDDLRCVATAVFADGAFRQDCAALAIVTTALPFKLFRSHHFLGSAEPLVVTEADAAQRIVREINGWPAAQAYAQAIGVAAEDLTPAHFAAAPLVVRINGNDYVRSVRQVNADGSLTLYCAIERGVVLHVASSLDLVQTRQATFDELHKSIGTPQLVLGVDCVYCQLEAQRTDAKSAIEQLFMSNRVVGFSSYGEQFMGIHVNQTFTGVAIGEAG
jgi:hypothetical protein